MLFKQTWMHPTASLALLKNTFKMSTNLLLQYTSADQTTSTRQHSTSGKRRWFVTNIKPWESEVCLNGTTILFIFFCSRWDHLLIPGWLSQLLGRLRLLLGDLLLRHDGHPWWYWPSDGLLSYVVVVDEGKEAPTAPRALRRVVAIHPSWHAATLLLQRGKKNRHTKSWLNQSVCTMVSVLWLRVV